MSGLGVNNQEDSYKAFGQVTITKQAFESPHGVFTSIVERELDGLYRDLRNRLQTEWQLRNTPPDTFPEAWAA